jgi:solute carrier family 39 (zinc transporter), member 9
MADGFIMLLFLSGIMAVGSFVAGAAPLSFTLSAHRLRIITTLGSGLLIGIALVIIIPEGAESLYGSQRKSGKRAANYNHVENQTSPHSVLGLCLIIGFALMYLIDMIPSSSAHRDSLEGLALTSTSSPPSSPFGPPAQSHSHTHSTTIGLVIHSFADGIALGASSATPSSIGIIVFAAIMVHKAPAAFGLTAALLKQGLNKRAARTHLLLFSLAAPLGAVTTWLFVKALASRGLDTANAGHGEFWTGVALVFSGGTFL